MNKKDLADLRKEFKIASYVLPIKEVYSVYIKKDSGQIITNQKTPLEMMDIETRELYLNNFKKALTGSIDSKIFELDFKKEVENSTNGILQSALANKEDMSGFADKVIDKIIENFNYDTDIVVNFIKAEYYKGSKKDNAEDYIQSIEFILCTVNKVEIPKKVLKFDYSEMAFKANSALDMPINLNSPLDGFLYPSFGSDYVDVNKCIYYSHKAKQLNDMFVQGVLDCNIKPTAAEEKESFKSILQQTLENEVDPHVLHGIYEELNERMEQQDYEDGAETAYTVDSKEMANILQNSGIENTEPVRNAFEDVCGGDYEFKAKNILPDFNSKSIKIENDVLKIEVVPGHLDTIKQIRDKHGRKCLQIVLSEDVNIDGINLKTDIGE